MMRTTGDPTYHNKGYVMNFIEAVKIANSTGQYVRRKVWVPGVVLFIARPKSKDDKSYTYSMQSGGKPYIATCHVAVCELSGVRDVTDVLADDWETTSP